MDYTFVAFRAGDNSASAAAVGGNVGSTSGRNHVNLPAPGVT